MKEVSAEDQALNAMLDSEIATYRAAKSRIELLSAKLTARAILREYPDATHLSLDYSDQTLGEMVPNEVLDANGDAIDADNAGFWDDLEDADIGGLVGNLTDDGDWTVCRDFATDEDRQNGENPRLNLAAAAALDTDQIVSSTGIKTVSQEVVQATPAPVDQDDDSDDDYDDDAICLCDGVAADHRPWKNCPIHGRSIQEHGAQATSAEEPPASPLETSGAQRAERPPAYIERSPEYKTAMRVAQSYLGRFHQGDHVVVAAEDGTEHLARITSDRRSDGEFGSPESRTLRASLGVGKYTFDVDAQKLAVGRLGIRAARPDELPAAQTQFDAAEAANVIRQRERVAQANVRLAELQLPQVGEEAVAWPDSDFPVRGRVHDITADGSSVAIIRDGEAGTSLIPASVIAPAAP